MRSYLVFISIKGGGLALGRLSRLFRNLHTESGLPPVRLHDLRHGAATFALVAWVDLKTVQAMLGHASIVLTADTYTSVLPKVAHEAAALVLRDARSAPCAPTSKESDGAHTGPTTATPAGDRWALF
ncbi:tyrosine-type recombinase/integrase [Nocardiopsis sp. NPDC055879]